MAYLDFDGSGEQEILATAYTVVLYEQEFKRDIIKDVFGRIDLRKAGANVDENGNVVVLDYTMDDWNAELRALWALLKTAYELSKKNNEKRKRIPGFAEWVLGIGAVNFSEISHAVVAECDRGFFRSGNNTGPDERLDGEE